MYRWIIGNSGYAEDGQLGFTIWSRMGPSYHEPLLALRSLATDLLGSMVSSILWTLDEYKKLPKCHKHKLATSELVYCKECGQKLRPDFYPEDYISYINSLPSKTADNFGGEDGLANWWPWVDPVNLVNADRDSVITVTEYFDTFLAYSCQPVGLSPEETEDLYELQRDLLTPKVEIKDGVTIIIPDWDHKFNE